MRTLTIEPSRSESNTGTTAPPRKNPEWRDGKRCPIAAALAREFGVAPGTLERQMRSWNHAVAKVLRTMREHGAEKRADAYVEPILRANDGREPPPDCEATWNLFDVADAREDVRQHEYERTPNLKTRAAYITALRDERRHITAVLDMLLDEQERAERQQDRLQ